MSARIRALRLERGWSQAELARRAGLSRPEVSAVETGRVVPSVHAALGLGRAFGVAVEALFSAPRSPVTWAVPPAPSTTRAWIADVGARRFAYPCASSVLGLRPHDVVVGSDGVLPEAEPPPTLVMAGCDPAVALLADALSRRGIRVLALARSSGEALELLKQGVVHVAGVHLGRAGPRSNARAVKQRLGAGHGILRWANWQEGLVTAPGTNVDAGSAARLARLSWVGRETGSGARACIEELFEGRRVPRFSAMARDHRSVTEAIRLGAAEAGVCVRLAAEEAGLRFVPLRDEAYDLCFRTDLDSELTRALSSAVRGADVRRLLSELPGYDAASTGELVAV